MAVRDTRATPVQLEKLLSYMIDHPEFAHGKLLGQQGRKKAMEMWESLTHSLNALGSSKPVYKWQKCWNDWKNNVKKKVQKLKAHAKDPSSGSPCIPISGIEKRLLEWMTPESLEEDTNLLEAGRFSDIPIEVIFNGRKRVSEFDIPVDVDGKRARAEGRQVEGEERQLEDCRIVLEEKRDAGEERILALEEKRDAREERRLALEEKRDAREERWFALEEKRDTREERRLVFEEKRDAREERKLALEERRNTRENRLLALEEKRDAREDRRLALEEKWGAREDKILIVEEKRDVQKDRKLAVEEGCKRRQETCSEREEDGEQIEERCMADGLS